MTVEWVRFGKVFDLSRAAVDVDLDTVYRPVGVRGFGRGLFDYPQTKGADLSKVRYFDLPDQALVISNIKGWEGAVDITGPCESGRIASSRFLTYRPTVDLDLSFVRHWLLSDGGMSVLDRCSPGSADRNRTLSRKGLEASLVPLPPIDEQRRVAAHLDRVTERLTRAHEVASDHLFGVVSLPGLIAALLRRANLPLVTVGDLATVRAVTIHPGDSLQGAERFVGLEHIEPHTGRRAGSRPVVEESGRKFLFRPGQVTYGYLRPYLNKVWAADEPGLCSVEQFVLEPNDGVAPTLLSHLLRSSYVYDRAVADTNRLQLPRLRQSALLSFEVPDIRSAPTDLTHEIDALVRQIVDLEGLRRRRQACLDGLLPAARNEIFSAMR